jgi:hypothetical protein
MKPIIKTVGLAGFFLASSLASAPAVFAQPYDERGYYDGESARQAQIDRDRRDYDARYGPGAYDRYYSRRLSDEACREKKSNNQVAGGLLGGIAGAVIGSNVARGGGRTGGAIIGGAAGAVAGSSIAKGEAKCD